jgi:hypothetical protein
MAEYDTYLYCFSNPSMPAFVKVGCTTKPHRTPRDRLFEANKHDTWKPPLPYTIEFAKKVCNAPAKEKILHKLLEKHFSRPNPNQEFFKTTPREVRLFFDLIDGEMWEEQQYIPAFTYSRKRRVPFEDESEQRSDTYSKKRRITIDEDDCPGSNESGQKQISFFFGPDKKPQFIKQPLS